MRGDFNIVHTAWGKMIDPRPSDVDRGCMQPRATGPPRIEHMPRKWSVTGLDQTFSNAWPSSGCPAPTLPFSRTNPGLG